ncbi:recombinase family protein [Gemmata sp.]|uniref:recombinase family protein n=1 Tax=Gemmata sp. TaxID=1914242 RepID=UPI003F6EF046
MAHREQPGDPATPTAYSYVRFSSPTQAEGDSIRRQTELRDAWLRKSNAVLDTSLTLRDEGVSAYSGAHRENADRTALAAFLELVRRGRIPRGSYLIVESLDRLTREHIRPALTLFLNLIEQGIRVVQLLPVETVYDDKVEPMSLMMAIMELSRGHSESRMKSERLGRVWSEKKKSAATAGAPITRAVPAWVRVRGNSFVLVPEKAAAVRRIFELATAGYGLGAITKKLNGEKVPAIGRAPKWARSYVAKILGNRSTFGEYQPHKGHASATRKPDGPPVSGYFPSVVAEDVFLAAQTALTSRRNKGGRPLPQVAIFTGLLRDARDGGTFHVTNKGEKSAGRALAPANAIHGVPGAVYVAFPLDVFEEAILSQLREIDPRDVLPQHDAATDRASVLSGRLAELDNLIALWTAKMDDPSIVDTVAAKLGQLNTERRKLLADLADAQREAASPLGAAWGEAKVLAEALRDAPDQIDARTRLRAAVRRITEEVRCLFIDAGPARVAVVQLWFTGGAQRSYLIEYHRGHGNASAARPATSAVRSFAEAGLSCGDLRKPDEAALLERLILKHASTATAETTAPVASEESKQIDRPRTRKPSAGTSKRSGTDKKRRV